MIRQSDAGYVEITGVILLLFVSSALACALLCFDATRRFSVRSIEREGINRDARKIALSLLGDMSFFLEETCDSRNSDAYRTLIDQYAENSLELDDVSSGYNLAFMPEGDFAERLSASVFLPGKESSFLEAVIKDGPPRSTDDLKGYVREEALGLCVAYGWVHELTPVSPGFRYIARLYGTENQGKLFPLVNELPLINVNFAPREVIRYYLTNPKYVIERREEKAKSLCDLAEVGAIDVDTLRSILEAERTNAIYSAFGVKTTFWRATYRVRGRSYRCVLCALPSHDNPDEIDRYEMISWGLNDG